MFALGPACAHMLSVAAQRDENIKGKSAFREVLSKAVGDAELKLSECKATLQATDASAVAALGEFKDAIAQHDTAILTSSTTSKWHAETMNKVREMKRSLDSLTVSLISSQAEAALRVKDLSEYFDNNKVRLQSLSLVLTEVRYKAVEREQRARQALSEHNQAMDAAKEIQLEILHAEERLAATCARLADALAEKNCNEAHYKTSQEQSALRGAELGEMTVSGKVGEGQVDAKLTALWVALEDTKKRTAAALGRGEGLGDMEEKLAGVKAEIEQEREREKLADAMLLKTLDAQSQCEEREREARDELSLVNERRSLILAEAIKLAAPFHSTSTVDGTAITSKKKKTERFSLGELVALGNAEALRLESQVEEQSVENATRQTTLMKFAQDAAPEKRLTRMQSVAALGAALRTTGMKLCEETLTVVVEESMRTLQASYKEDFDALDNLQPIDPNAKSGQSARLGVFITPPTPISPQACRDSLEPLQTEALIYHISSMGAPLALISKKEIDRILDSSRGQWETLIREPYAQAVRALREASKILNELGVARNSLTSLELTEVKVCETLPPFPSLAWDTQGNQLIKGGPSAWESGDTLESSLQALLRRIENAKITLQSEAFDRLSRELEGLEANRIHAERGVAKMDADLREAEHGATQARSACAEVYARLPPGEAQRRGFSPPTLPSSTASAGTTPVPLAGASRFGTSGVVPWSDMSLA